MGAAYCAIMLVVGCAKLERRDAVVALVAHAAALLTAYRVHASALWFAASASRTEAALAAINVFLWSVNLVYVLGYANVLPLVASRSSSPPCAPRPIRRPSRDNFCGELRPRRRRRLSARLMRILSGEPVPTERLATYDDTRQIFAD